MRNTTSDISPTHCAKVNSRVYCNRALSLNTRSSFSASKMRSSIPRTMTLTGLRSRNFSKHSPRIIVLAPEACHFGGLLLCNRYYSKASEITKDSHLYRDGRMWPPCFPSYKTVQRRLALWLELDAFRIAWRQLAQRYEALQGINWDE